MYRDQGDGSALRTLAQPPDILTPSRAYSMLFLFRRCHAGDSDQGFKGLT